MRDKSTIASLYYQQSEDNIRKVIRQPYVSLGSDGASMSDIKIFEDWGTHPRAYGTFARFLGKYVRDEKLIPMEEAIRRLTLLPATNLKIKKRGKLEAGYYADIAIFNAATIKDHATFEDPKQYAEGMVHVFVNGTAVLLNGEHTGATPGRIVRGPGYKR
jgi:N-acyl-D-amino-acid deacylase